MKSIRNSNGRVVAVTSALVLAVVIGAGFFLRPAVRAQNSAEAAVRDVLMKSALSFEKNDRAMAPKSGPMTSRSRSSSRGMRTTAGPITATIISSLKWAR